jgi:hypothetical protein
VVAARRILGVTRRPLIFVPAQDDVASGGRGRSLEAQRTPIQSDLVTGIAAYRLIMRFGDRCERRNLATEWQCPSSSVELVASPRGARLNNGIDRWPGLPPTQFRRHRFPKLDLWPAWLNELGESCVTPGGA